MGARESAVAGALTAALAATAAAAQQAPDAPQIYTPPPATYPSGTAREALSAWLRKETDITPSQVVAVSPSTVTAIVSTFPSGGGRGPRVVIRAETIDKAVAVREGALSWHLSLNADCAGRKVQVGETTGYADRNLLGTGRMLRPAEPEWREPEPGTPLENVWRAACESGFRRPLEPPRGEVAQAPIATAPRAVPPHRAEPPAAAPEREVPAAPPPARAEVPQPPAQVRARTQGRAAVQVLASPIEAEARAALGALQRRLDGQTVRVEAAQVKGRTWHRALVEGFADAHAAARFCEALRAVGKSCFVRGGGG